jgi:hypothetical protein
MPSSLEGLKASGGKLAIIAGSDAYLGTML